MNFWAENIYTTVTEIFKTYLISNGFAALAALVFNIIFLSLVAYCIYYICRRILIYLMILIARKTNTTFDDLLVSNKTAKYIAHLIPLFFIEKSIPIIFLEFNYWEGVVEKLINIYIVIMVLWIIRTVFNALRDYLKQQAKYSDKPIDSYIQVVMIVLWAIGIITIIMQLFNLSSTKIFTTFGAVSAIILLIFKDTILGFIASIQVSVNDMVRIGDWITMEKFGADGDVIEINLATVKVRNFDKTISTIPTYSLISDSFKNWRGMFNSDGRRIKRHVLIKANSIRFLQEEELENLKKIQLISKYIEEKQNEINLYNRSHNHDKSLAINGRNLTNFGLFRMYINEYLSQHTGLSKNMIMMCRQLQPNEFGVPLEIYAFSSNKTWLNYEFVMADIFDHIIAAVVYFDLKIYELPSSNPEITEL